MASDLIRQGTYREGFEAGFRAVRGIAAVLPVLPVQPVTRANMTPFLMGIRKGIERADVDLP